MRVIRDKIWQGQKYRIYTFSLVSLKMFHNFPSISFLVGALLQNLDWTNRNQLSIKLHFRPKILVFRIYFQNQMPKGHISFEKKTKSAYPLQKLNIVFFNFIRKAPNFCVKSDLDARIEYIRRISSGNKCPPPYESQDQTWHGTLFYCFLHLNFL